MRKGRPMARFKCFAASSRETGLERASLGGTWPWMDCPAAATRGEAVKFKKRNQAIKHDRGDNFIRVSCSLTEYYRLPTDTSWESADCAAKREKRRIGLGFFFGGQRYVFLTIAASLAR